MHAQYRLSLLSGGAAKLMVRSQEAFNFYSHLAGMAAAAVGTVFLVMRAADSTYIGRA